MRAARIAVAWWQTRRAMRWSPERLARGRARQWRALQPALAAAPATAARAREPLSAHPVIDPAVLRADYGGWNSVGLSDAALRALADGQPVSGVPPGLSAGWSTGTGGARGLFAADAAERADYIGQSLARLLPPGALLRRQRLALVLRAGNALYSDVRGGRTAFRHFPLDLSDEALWAGLAVFDPTILVAPPHRLLALAAAPPALRHLFYGSEPMSAAEADLIEARLGHRPRAIYQATEGFLGADCAEGRLHLNEHALVIEREPVPGTPGFRPVVTDLRRRTQPIIRVRLDDYLEADDAPCACGYAGATVRAVAGRVQDIWRWPNAVVTPSAVQERVEDALGGGVRWQAIGAPDGVRLRVAPDCPPAAREAARARLAASVPCPVSGAADLAPPSGPKRRKVVWRDG